MSFLKITDPTKRDQTIKEYLELKKNIRNNLLSERVGEQQLQTELTKFYRPITESQKATAKEITESQPQREKLPKDLGLLEKVSRAYQKPCYLLVKHREKHRRKKKKMN